MNSERKLLINEKNLRLMKYNKKHVIVRIWTSSINPSYPGKDVGHVSIETCGYSNQYISLWPKESVYFKESVPSRLPKSFIEDVRLEEDRRPELTFYFYTLDIHNINKKWGLIEKSLPSWSLLGLCKNSRNCASLAWALLEAGNIGKLVSPLTQSSVCCKRGTQDAALSKEEASIASLHAGLFNSNESKIASTKAIGAASHSSEMAISLIIKSPDALAELLQKAKIKEWEIHPLTQEIETESEWKKPDKKSRCIIS